MKKFIYTLIIAIVFAATKAGASGKFILSPEKNLTKGTHSIEMGLAIYENLMAKKLFLNHYSGIVTAENDVKSFYEAKSFSFKNGLVFQPVNVLQFEIGHEWHKDMKSDYAENIGYMKVSSQLW
jgi:hypothetical protein